MPSTAPAAPAAPTKGERTRARILAAAAEHFAAVGFDAGSVPEIARRIGMSHATLYQHFGRKDELFRAAVEADLTALFATAAPALRSPTLDPNAVVALVPALVAATRTHPLARRVLAGIDAEQTEVLRDLPALAELEQQLAAALAAAQERGVVRDDLPAPVLAAGLISVALPLLVVALRLEGMEDVPRAGAALEYLATTLRPQRSRRTT
jgi:AcrR family transcriptional regulator